MFHYIYENLSFYMVNKLISTEAARNIMDNKDKAVKDFLPYMNDAVEALGNLPIPDSFAPMARDYVSWNAQTNLDDISKAGPLFDF